MTRVIVSAIQHHDREVLSMLAECLNAAALTLRDRQVATAILDLVLLAQQKAIDDRQPSRAVFVEGLLSEARLSH